MQTKTKKLYRMVGQAPKHWVGDGFWVSTMFSLHTQSYRYLSPFIMMDYAAPKRFEASTTKRGVGAHPHRGFETVTVALQGSIDHKDSAGGRLTIEAKKTCGRWIMYQELNVLTVTLLWSSSSETKTTNRAASSRIHVLA